MRRGVVSILFFMGFYFLFSTAPRAGIGDFLRDLQKSMGTSEGPSDSKVIKGLKEALEIGTGNAVNIVSQVDGYYKNQKIKIPLPSQVKKVEKVLRAIGYGSELDAFELSMNRAAENAAPKAKDLFLEAIKQMSFQDARKILKGRENEATLYLEEKTRDKLTTAFKPIIDRSMSRVGVIEYYRNLDDKLRGIPFAESFRFDLTQYVSDRSLDGLFLMLAQEERKIRENPAARVTELLKEVFGGKK